MTEQDKTPFFELLAPVADMCAGNPPGPGGMALFFATMRPWSLEQVANAVAAHVRRSKFFPRPAELIDILEGTETDRATLAWNVALEASQEFGSYESVIFEDPGIHYAITAMGGWEKFGQMTENERPFRFKDFSTHYGIAARTRIAFGSPGCPQRLIGATERTNLFNGQPTPAPCKIEAHRPALVPLEGNRLEALIPGGPAPENLQTASLGLMKAVADRRRLAE